MKGWVNLICDGWQASNINAYFAVTRSWIEEWLPGMWDIHTTLLGFTCLNSAHNGVHLGQALYKVVAQLGIAHKVSSKFPKVRS